MQQEKLLEALPHHAKTQQGDRQEALLHRERVQQEAPQQECNVPS